MALVAFEGFDHYAANNPGDLLNRRGALQWTGAAGSFVAGRVGSGLALQIIQGNVSAALALAQASGFIGFGLIIGGGTSFANFLINDFSGGSAQLGVVFNTLLNRVEVWRGPVSGAPLWVSANNVFSAGIWYYFEIGMTIHPTAGAIEIRLNGQTVLSLSGINTRASANSQFDGFTFFTGFATASQVLTIDDLYLCDATTGPGPYAFNSFVGDVRVATLNPIGAGGATSWTPLSGANWQQVAEAYADGDTSYNATLTPGAQDLFAFADLPATISAVLAVQVSTSARKDDAGTHLLTQQVLSGATLASGTALSLPSGYVYLNDLWVTDPDTALSGWTIGAVNALQAGYVLTS
jgi:hypothetical protein